MYSTISIHQTSSLRSQLGICSRQYECYMVNLTTSELSNKLSKREYMQYIWRPAWTDRAAWRSGDFKILGMAPDHQINTTQVTVHIADLAYRPWIIGIHPAPPNAFILASAARALRSLSTRIFCSAVKPLISSFLISSAVCPIFPNAAARPASWRLPMILG